jgi:hypothetical protein
MRWAVIQRRPQLRTPLPHSDPRARTPDDGRGTPDESESFDLRRPRDLLVLAFIGMGVGCLLGVWIAGPALHPIHMTVPVAFAVVFVMMGRTFRRGD